MTVSLMDLRKTPSIEGEVKFEVIRVIIEFVWSLRWYLALYIPQFTPSTISWRGTLMVGPLKRVRTIAMPKNGVGNSDEYRISPIRCPPDEEKNEYFEAPKFSRLWRLISLESNNGGGGGASK